MWNFFQKADHVDCKIIAFEVKKRSFFAFYEIWSINFKFLWLKKFALYKVKDTELKIHRKIKIERIFIFIL
jgi:hypothetical protein